MGALGPDGLAPLSLSTLFDHVDPMPIAPIAVALAAFWYLRRVRAMPTGEPWPVRRTISFGTGLVLVLWTTEGGLQAYSSSLFWVWTAQMLMVLLIAPILLITGQPVELARRSNATWLVRIADGRAARFAGNPLIGPALIPVISAVLFFGPIPGWSISHPALGWTLPVLVLLLGCALVLPILDVQEHRTSLVIGAALAVGFVELLLDAIPGIVLRLQTHQSSSFAEQRTIRSWTGSALHDQQNAGTLLWSVAELLDVPFLIVLFVRWVRADAREATAADARLDDAALEQVGTAAEGSPWWLSDPEQRRRMGRP